MPLVSPLYETIPPGPCEIARIIPHIVNGKLWFQNHWVLATERLLGERTWVFGAIVACWATMDEAIVSAEKLDAPLRRKRPARERIAIYRRTNEGKMERTIGMAEMDNIKPDNGETWLVCGGRDINDYEVVDTVLDRIAARIGRPASLIHGDARGVDRIAGAWGAGLGCMVIPVPAQWDKYGKQAGYLRNETMADMRPDRVIAFPGGRGTMSMVKIAVQRGILVQRVVHRPRGWVVQWG